MGPTQSSVATLKNELGRLARFGANISDAHSCLIFLPGNLLASAQDPNRSGALLELAAGHSLSNDVLKDILIPSDSGLIGWVARHNRSIHVSPFERDSRTLGIYSVDQHLKSFIGIPVDLTGLAESAELAGVIACDSRKAFAFSKIQGKLLEDLSLQVSTVVRLSLQNGPESRYQSSWRNFVELGHELALALGAPSIQVLRLRLTNFPELEAGLGTSAGLDLVDQVFRLFHQALPPHFPAYKLPNGDVLIILDNMMSAFYENKFEAITTHVAVQGYRPIFEYLKSSFRERRTKTASLLDLISDTASPETSARPNRGMNYEYRRA